MPSPKVLKRLVTCQGSIQLVTALSVLSYREKEQQLGCEYENYLVIYDLYAPLGQIDAFAAFIRRMAELICDWKEIAYINPEQMNAIAGKLDSSSPSNIFRRVYGLVGTDSADEIYLCRNWQFGNQLLINAYQSAHKICYGDSIGIYFSSASKAVLPVATKQKNLPSQSSLVSLSYLKAKLINVISNLKEKLKLKSSLKNIEFDIGYFVLPNIMGEIPPMKTVIPDTAVILGIIQKLRSLVDSNYIIQLQKIIGDAPVSILLTSNFSEAGLMSQENEIIAYRQFLISEGIQDTVLVIKPHPRTENFKMKKLEYALDSLCSSIVNLTEPILFFLPFEIFFVEAFLQPTLKNKSNIRVFAVSSACLSMKLLFNISSVVGFGEHITSKFFYKTYAAGRWKHELELTSAIEKI